MVVGDSVAVTMAIGLEREGPALGIWSWNRGTLGCGFLPGDEELDVYSKWSTVKAETCKEWRSTWSSDVDEVQPDVVVLLFGAWDVFDLKVGGRLLEVGTPEWEAYALEELSHTVDVASARGAKVILLTSPCFRPRELGLGADSEARLNPERVDDLNDVYWEFARQHVDQVVIVDLNGLVCPGGEYTDVTIDSVRLREDGVHFTSEGAKLVARWLAPEIIAALPEERRPTPGVGASGEGGVLGALARAGVNLFPAPSKTRSTWPVW
jgi:hypothetical protein